MVAFKSSSAAGGQTRFIRLPEARRKSGFHVNGGKRAFFVGDALTVAEFGKQGLLGLVPFVIAHVEQHIAPTPVFGEKHG